MVAVLPCTISKLIRRRILVSEVLLARLFEHAGQLHRLSVESAKPSEKDFIKSRPPTIEISYTDGTAYEIRDSATLREIVPGRGKQIESIKLYSRVGDFTCSVDLKTYTTFDSILVRASGLEDKIGHFIDTIVAELTRETDVTVFAKRVWGGVWALVFSLLVWLSLGWRQVHDWQTAYGLGLLIFITAVVLSIPIEIFRRRWLPPVAFLWGEDGLRAKQARILVTIVVATVPLGILINGISALFFG